jgi:hypothetical protein
MKYKINYLHKLYNNGKMSFIQKFIMKKIIVILTSFIVLNGCKTIKFAERPEDINESLNVIAEVCTIDPDDHLFGRNTQRNTVIISSNPYTLNLHGSTVDNMSLFIGNVGMVQELTYVTFLTRNDSLALFKRDFTKYKLGQWSVWENPDYLVKNGDSAETSFFWLSTRSKDRLNELKKVQSSQVIKVRFKLMKLKDYFGITNVSKDIEKDMPSCL